LPREPFYYISPRGNPIKAGKNRRGVTRIARPPPPTALSTLAWEGARGTPL
jgi:hypothetical protein